MKTPLTRALAAALLLLAAAAARKTDIRVSAAQDRRVVPTPATVEQLIGLRAKIQHIVFIVKENRSFDNFFGTFPGADGTTTAIISTGEEIQLGHTPDRTPHDLGHEWEDTHLAMDDGRMDRFDLVTNGNVNGDMLSVSQHRDFDIPNYWNYAEHFALADHMFSSLAGPSFPNHLYTVAAQSGGVFTNPNSLNWGCDAAANVTAGVMDADGNTSRVYPCFEYQTMADRLETARRIVALLCAGAWTAGVHLVSAQRHRPYPADFALGRSRADRRTVPRRRLERIAASHELARPRLQGERSPVARRVRQRQRLRRRKLDGAPHQCDHAGRQLAVHDRSCWCGTTSAASTITCRRLASTPTASDRASR